MSELAQFHQFLAEKLADGGSQLSPEEVLREWRAVHPSSDLLADDYEAVRRALDEMEAGDTGTPFDDFDRQFRAKHNLPPRA
jgi:hypothetical protein